MYKKLLKLAESFRNDNCRGAAALLEQAAELAAAEHKKLGIYTLTAQNYIPRAAESDLTLHMRLYLQAMSEGATPATAQVRRDDADAKTVDAWLAGRARPTA